MRRSRRVRPVRFLNAKAGSGIGFGGNRWTPARVLGSLGAWFDFRADSRGTYAVAPALVNGDFESGTAGWAAVDSSLSPVSPSPALGSTAALRVTATGATFWAQQYILISGNAYRIRGWMRSDGTATPVVLAGSPSAIVHSGIASTTWQYFDAVATALGSNTLFLGSLDSSGWVEFDNFTIENLSLTQFDPRAATGALAGSALVQASDAAMPWFDADGLGTGLGACEFDGTADYDASDAMASAWSLHKAAGGSITLVCKPSASGAGIDTIYDTCDGDANNVGFCIDYDTAAETVRLLVTQDGTGTFAVNDSTAMSKGPVHVVTASWSSAGYSIQVDGGVAVTGSITGSLSANEATTTLQRGRKSGGSDFWRGHLGEQVFRVGADLSAINKVRDYLRTRYGV